MATVTHKVKQKVYHYPDDATAHERAKQAADQSEGKLTFVREKEGAYVVLPATKGKE